MTTTHFRTGHEAGAPERRAFPKGTTIFKEGERADAGYIVETGSVQIFKMIGGRRVLLGTIGPWGMFGELGLIDDSPRMAAAYTTEDTVCMVISKEAVALMLDAAPAGLGLLVQSMAETIRKAGEDLADSRFQLLEKAKLS